MAETREAEIVQSVLQDLSIEEGNKATFNAHYDEIAELLWPNMRNTFYRGSFNTPGEKKTDRQLDSTPTIALNQFGAILDSLLTPRNATWHRLRPSNKELLKSHAVKVWFDDLTRLMFEYRYAPAANFSTNNQRFYKGLGAFGSSSMFVDVLRKGGPGIRYKAVHIGQCYWRENHQGIVDWNLREIEMTAVQLMARDEWKDKIPENVKTAAAKRPSQKFKVLHRVRARSDYDPEAYDQRSLAFESCYVLQDGKTLLEEGGYNSFPYPSSRYDEGLDEVYGRSPAMDCLSSIKTLMTQKRTVLTAGHRAVNPMILAADDGIVDNIAHRPGHIVAGGVNADGRPLVQPFPAGRIDIGKELMDDERAQINASFLVHLFQILIETPRMTATEVIERTREKGILLAPTIGRQESEYLGPLIMREMDVLAQQGLLPPMPPELIEAEGEYKIEYDNPLSRMAKAEQAAGFIRTIETILPVVNVTQDPAPLDNFDFDVITRELSDLQAVPATWMKPVEQVQALRGQRAQMQQQQMDAAAAPGQAALVKAAADAKSKGLTAKDLR